MIVKHFLAVQSDILADSGGIVMNGLNIPMTYAFNHVLR